MYGRFRAFHVVLVVRSPSANAGDRDIETRVRSLDGEDALEKGMATHSSFFCLENPMDRGASWTTVHGITKSRT